MSGIAVLIGLGLVLATKWLPFDPICGILMALNILRTGVSLMRSAFSGLMDQADPEAYLALTTLLDSETTTRGMTYHQARRSRSSRTWCSERLAGILTIARNHLTSDFGL